MSDQTTATQLTTWRARINSALSATLDTVADTEPTLLAAMRHAVLIGGKRLRPLLVYASGHAADSAASPLDAAAVAVELVHAYSLVHDDLPAMDNDTLRRGQPTVHMAFGQAQAILAGDALQTLAFQTLAEAPLPAETRIGLLTELARAAGAVGMCGGQALDAEATGHPGTTTLATLERLHTMKTGALLRAAVRMGAMIAGVEAGVCAKLNEYAKALGLAFQIRDDLLDVEGDSMRLGKTAGKDQLQDKATFPALIGVEGSRQRLHALTAQMHEALSGLPPSRRAPLDALAHLAVERHY